MPRPHKQTKANAVADRLELSADLSNLQHFIDFVCSKARRLGFPPQRIQEIELVLEEALVNTIEYAYPDGAAGNLTLKLEQTAADCLCLEIQDHGVPFNPLAQSDPDIDLTLEERPVGGLGILLIKELADELNWYRKDNRNHFTLTFSRRHV